MKESAVGFLVRFQLQHLAKTKLISTFFTLVWHWWKPLVVHSFHCCLKNCYCCRGQLCPSCVITSSEGKLCLHADRCCTATFVSMIICPVDRAMPRLQVPVRIIRIASFLLNNHLLFHISCLLTWHKSFWISWIFLMWESWMHCRNNSGVWC